MLDEEPLILCAAPDSWKELLSAAGVRSLEVLTSSSVPARSKLAVVSGTNQIVNDLTGMSPPKAWVKPGIGVIWLTPTSIPKAAIEASYYVLSGSNTSFIIAQENTLTNLAVDPWAQLRFLRMARLATGYEHLTLPKTSP